MRSRLSLICIAISFLAMTMPSHAQNLVYVGARPMALGETYVAVADDGNAQYWNPAGLCLINHYEVNSMYADLFRTGVKNNYLSFLVPFSNRLAFGLDWFNIGFDDDELGFSENLFSFSMSYKIMNALSVGANLKYMATHTKLDGNTEADGKGWGADLGLLAHITPKLKIGVMAHDLIETNVRYKQSDRSDQLRRRNFRLGASYIPIKNLLVAADIDDRIHFGSEYNFFNILSLRAGLQKDLNTSEALTLSFGVGMKWQFVKMDYAYTISPVLENTSRFSLGFYFNLFPSKVRIEEIRMKQIYPSQYRNYTENPIGTVRLINVGEDPIDARLSVFIPNWMDRPTERAVVVRPKMVDDFPVYALLKENILDLKVDLASSATVEVSYATERKTYTDETNASVIVYNKNAVNWTESGIAAAAAFVTSTDETIQNFNRENLFDVEEDPVLRKSNSVSRAIQIFNGLQLHGLQYIEDPNAPYSVVSRTEQAVDNIQYPSETLNRKRGDCDDLTVLYAALLENAGIPAAFLDIPEHLFLMIDTGLMENQRLAMGISEDKYVIHDHMVWIPIEITRMADSFYDAWIQGAERFYRYEAMSQLRIIPIHDAWDRFPAVQYHGAVATIAVNDRESKNKYQSMVDSIHRERLSFIEAKQPSSQYTDAENIQLVNDLGIYYALSGNFDASFAILNEAAGQYRDPRLFNNLGNACMLQQNIDEAINYYQRAQALAPDDGGIYINMGVSFLTLSDTTNAETLFQIAESKYEDLSELLLQIGIRRSELNYQKGRVGDPNKEELLLRFKKIEQKRGVRPAGMDLNAILEKYEVSSLRGEIGKILSVRDIEHHLYWKK